MTRRAIIFWFTGLSGAGKSTLATDLQQRLAHEGLSILVLDGDEVRNRLHRHLGFTPAEIRENNALIVDLCCDNRHLFDAIMVPIISPYRDSREHARQRLAPGFHEVHIAADLGVLAIRDTKGLYRAARRNEIDNVIGVSPKNIYEPPIAADLVIDTSRDPLMQSCSRLFHYARSVLSSLRSP